MIAARDGKIDTVVELVKKGADIHMQNIVRMLSIPTFDMTI